MNHRQRRWTTRAPRYVFVFLLLPIFRLGPVAAEELVTDRPDQTESAEVVAKGKTQLEIGWLYTRAEPDRDKIGRWRPGVWLNPCWR
ncbi:MAG: hypothetical protein GY719_29635 [bacterium]|nr:hypothetical protein [bacterium]